MNHALAAVCVTKLPAVNTLEAFISEMKRLGFPVTAESALGYLSLSEEGRRILEKEFFVCADDDTRNLIPSISFAQRALHLCVTNQNAHNLVPKLTSEEFKVIDAVRALNWLKANRVLLSSGVPETLYASPAFLAAETNTAVFCDGNTVTDAHILLLHLMHKGGMYVMYTRNERNCAWLERNRSVALFDLDTENEPYVTAFVLSVAWAIGSAQQHAFTSRCATPQVFVYSENEQACTILQTHFPAIVVRKPGPVILKAKQNK